VSTTKSLAIESAASERDTAGDALRSRTHRLAQSPSILDEFARSCRDRGVVGETRVLMLLYLVLTSRLLLRIVSAVLKGPSSAGKSFLAEQVLAYFPPAAYEFITAMSDKALVYDDSPLSHRFLVFAEAVGASGSTASYLIRSLLSEGRLVYKVKDPGGLGTRTLIREGPAGMLLTTTAIGLHPENETRMLSIPVDDSAAHTREVLVSLAEARVTPPVDPDWIALQEWLADSERRVVIPFARRLAELIPPIAIRLRRDFATVLSLIEAHALLHQATRARDDDGRIVAVEADYVAVRGLVAELLAEEVGTTVPPTVREAVEAVRRLSKRSGPPAVGDVAGELGVDPSAASRRVARAEVAGYLVRRKHGRNVSLSLAAALPGDVPVLPYAHAVFADSRGGASDDTGL
jgi:DNA-binding Lrp family transcriptional regulator